MQMPTINAMSSPSAAKAESFYSNQFLKGSDARSPTKVGRAFEAIFYRMILKQARETELATPLLDSPAMKQMREMQEDELATQLGNQGKLGIAKIVEDTLLLAKNEEYSIKKQQSGLLKG